MNSQYLYAEALRSALGGSTRWLDLGCGHQFLPQWLPESKRHLMLRECRAVGIDMDAESLRAHPDLRLRIVGSVEHMPIAAGTFDLVTANMVVEHVEQPDVLFQEVSRVLRPGGVFLVHTPNAQGYTTRLTQTIPPRWRPALAHLLQGRRESDVYRTYYRANTVDVLADSARRSGLTPVDLRTVESSPQLYRVPVARSIESALLRMLRSDMLARWRPCIIGSFERVS